MDSSGVKSGIDGLLPGLYPDPPGFVIDSSRIGGLSPGLFPDPPSSDSMDPLDSLDDRCLTSYS